MAVFEHHYDPFTAILCINRLGSALVKISLENAPSEKLKDEQGQIRIERNVASFEELVKTACNQLRQASLTHPNVVTSILDMLNNVCCSINNDQHKAYLVQQGSCLMDMIKTQNVHALDMQDIATKHDRLMKHSNSKR